MKASCRASARSLDLRAAHHGGPAVGMHVAEREHVAAVDLSVPEAVGIGEDEALVVLAGKLADERFVGLLPAARERRHAQKRRPSCSLMSNARSFSSRAGLSQVPRPFGQCPPLPTSIV